MQIMVEAPPMMCETPIQRSFARVSEGWMANVVDQCKRLREIFVQAERGGSGTGDLSDLNRMSQAAAKMIRRPARKDLSLASQAAKGAGLHNAFAITLKGRSSGARWRRIDAGQKKIVRSTGDRASMEIDCHSQT
jgi:hypothetical protein